MKTSVLFLNWQGIREVALTGVSLICGICGGVKSLKAKTCKRCSSAHKDAAKTVATAVSEFQIPIDRLDQEWRMLQTVCAWLEGKGILADDVLKAKLKKRYPRFSSDLVNKIVVVYRNWTECCHLLGKKEVNTRLPLRSLGRYASVLQERHPELRKFSHGMVLSALNMICEQARFLAELPKKRVNIICSENSNEIEDAIRLTREEIDKRELLRMLNERTLVVNHDILYVIRFGQLIFVGKCKPVFQVITGAKKQMNPPAAKQALSNQ